jgi:hypothetical protein
MPNVEDRLTNSGDFETFFIVKINSGHSVLFSRIDIDSFFFLGLI